MRSESRLEIIALPDWYVINALGCTSLELSVSCKSSTVLLARALRVASNFSRLLRLIALPTFPHSFSTSTMILAARPKKSKSSVLPMKALFSLILLTKFMRRSLSSRPKANRWTKKPPTNTPTCQRGRRRWRCCSMAYCFYDLCYRRCGRHHLWVSAKFKTINRLGSATI